MAAKWAWHKSIALPLGLRLNLSRTGVGFSWGVRGCRVGVDAHGRRYTSFSVAGLHKRSTQK